MPNRPRRTSANPGRATIGGGGGFNPFELLGLVRGPEVKQDGENISVDRGSVFNNILSSCLMMRRVGRIC